MMLFVSVSASKSVVYSSSWWRLLDAEMLTNNIILTPVNIKEPSSTDSQSGHFIICVCLFRFLATTRNRICWRTLLGSPTLYKARDHLLTYTFMHRLRRIVQIIEIWIIEVALFILVLACSIATPTITAVRILFWVLCTIVTYCVWFFAH